MVELLYVRVEVARERDAATFVVLAYKFGSV